MIEQMNVDILNDYLFLLSVGFFHINLRMMLQKYPETIAMAFEQVFMQNRDGLVSPPFS